MTGELLPDLLIALAAGLIRMVKAIFEILVFIGLAISVALLVYLAWWRIKKSNE